MFKGRDLLAYLSIIYRGEWGEMMKAIKNRQKFDIPTAEERMSKVKRRYLTLIDPEYPENFKEVNNPPFVLWYEGNLELLKNYSNAVTIVGSRECSEYGRKTTKRFASELAEAGTTIVSGLAKGIDAIALKEGIRYNKAIAVLGNGIDINYPNENKELQEKIARNGLILSEYPDGVAPMAHHFPERNRLLATLSRFTLLTEAHSRSGSLITANIALKAGNDVGAIPYHIDEDSVCNYLIQQGAYCVLEPRDVLESLRYPGYPGAAAKTADEWAGKA